ncbi:GTP-binding protein [Candidatus Thorarchaeota archaeon]|nr:MAG: GTP-binding protein [Candidatus Thorarchaeota archaeon]
MSPSYLYKVTTVGASAVGKTSIILRYTTGKFREYYTPTLGADFSVKSMQFGDDKVRLQIWDLGSQDFLGSVRAGYYQGTRGVVYMFDVTRPDTLNELWEWKKEVDSHTRGVECLVVANKTDLETEREVSKKEGEAFAKKFKAEYIEASVKLNEGVDDAFTTIAKAIRRE